jgi:hypothetical protein
MATVPSNVAPAQAGPGRVLEPLADRRTWGGALHLLLGLPLGVAYFTFYLTGFALGAGLAVVVVGIPILFAVLASIRPLAAFEARLARALTGIEVPDPPASPPGGLLARLGVLTREPATWRRLAYLLSRFPLGILSFTVAAVVIGVPVAMVLSPLLYAGAPVDLLVWHIDTLAESLVALGIGLLLVFRATCVLRILGGISGRYARLMLS